MTNPMSAELQHRISHQELFIARQALTHLVEMYSNGQWRLYYKTETGFAEAVREKREIFDRWNSLVAATAPPGR